MNVEEAFECGDEEHQEEAEQESEVDESQQLSSTALRRLQLTHQLRHLREPSHKIDCHADKLVL